MSEAAHYGERGGMMRAHAPSEPFRPTSVPANDAPPHHTSSAVTATTQHDYRFPRRPADSSLHAFGPPASATNNPQPPYGAVASGPREAGKLELSNADSVARKELLRESFFPSWRDDATVSRDGDSPDEMQKKDPLATQIWRLYSKTKKQLPNQERMENLTWRMMAMSLRKRKQEEAERYVAPAAFCEWTCWI